MAAAASVLGGLIGFFTALAGFLLFGVGLVPTLGLWAGAGLLAMAGLMVLGHLARAVPAPSGIAHSARA
jgi:hypothetical protein